MEVCIEVRDSAGRRHCKRTSGSTHWPALGTIQRSRSDSIVLSSFSVYRKNPTIERNLPTS